MVIGADLDNSTIMYDIITLIEKQLECNDVRLIYLTRLIELEKKDPTLLDENALSQLIKGRENIEDENQLLKGELTSLYLCLVDKCFHNSKAEINSKNKK
ncbi:hypothetical protein NPIL_569891 [Nephila pilipes]|uniref:Uncharacterized protein n=1 Tax=Nephila pilipes TaxID=299642 RepID=A0A8X6QHL8_NEPPI|nr:hypothetical protein NPIL_569891 [Nephila pilipes]